MVTVRCPNCQATYQLDPAKLADGGRKLKCAKCGTVWVARAEGTEPTAPPPAFTAPAPEPATIPATEPSAAETAQESPSHAPQEDNSPPPPEDPLIQRAPVVDDLVKVGGWRNAVRGDNIWRTGAMAFLGLGLIVGAYMLWSFLGHKETPKKAETTPLATAEEADHPIQPPPGLVLHHVRGDVDKPEGKNSNVTLTVHGLLTNTTSGSLIVPPLQLELLGTDGQVADMWPVPDISTTLPPAAEQAWSVSLTAPDMTAIRGWRVVFKASH